MSENDISFKATTLIAELPYYMVRKNYKHPTLSQNDRDTATSTLDDSNSAPEPPALRCVIARPNPPIFDLSVDDDKNENAYATTSLQRSLFDMKILN